MRRSTQTGEPVVPVPVAARRVAIHRAVDALADARRYQEAHEALSDALGHLSDVALGEDLSEQAWQAVAAIAQGQLEKMMEAREA